MDNQIKTYDIEQLTDVFSKMGQPKFRAKQLYEWLHVHQACSYDEMTNLPLSLRQQLSEEYPLTKLAITNKQVSQDGTRKYIFALEDDNEIEAVGIPSKEISDEGTTDTSTRLTVCFSTQVGCAMECAFCATGHEGFTRNLTASEMVEQISLIQKDFGIRVSNVVAMGQGEPFLNYEQLITALHIINSQDGMRIGARHITVSTCGVIKGIESFSKEPEQFTLAISLHSASQNIRDFLMPRVSNQPIEKLKEAIRRYNKKTGRRVTLEYMLIKGVNDGEDDLEALLYFCKEIFVHVNILTMNEIDDSPFQPSKTKVVKKWIDALERNHIEATVRNPRGSDIAGACGQLKNSK
ncbi:MAG: 23S rRNA (adenine(2503)-C(2))-methyltransferase RlmN [Eggerthellaceae bacterium]|nr:23S rRNA (adenine(2503)-C(2))-methyltransferase RlmN [Eggerthellaceae bacterium]